MAVFRELENERLAKGDNHKGKAEQVQTPTVSETPLQTIDFTRSADVDLGGGEAIELVWLPPGQFMMGSPCSEDMHDVMETQHKVKLTKSFWVGKYEVTQAQWEALMGSNPSDEKGLKRPVTNVSWDDCQEFVRKLTERGVGQFRLPTEAEWEYACRAGTTTPFYVGNTISSHDANYDGRSTCAVGFYRPNAWGLYNMHGNVTEWCQDWFGPYAMHGDWFGLYRPDVVEDPKGPDLSTSRVARGGSWVVGPGLCRSATRYEFAPESRHSFLGFRVVRDD